MTDVTEPALDKPDRILFASTNTGKAREVGHMLRDFDVPVIQLGDVSFLPAPEETGATFQDNADIKALYYARASGLWTLADDSGLEVDALGGAPGVHSARYAGPAATDRDNNVKLIAALTGIDSPRRTARFRCALTLASPDRIECRAQGAVEGHIIEEPRGDNGFGYDPHFFLAELDLTLAELPPDRKNAISHRGQALARLRGELEARWRREGNGRVL